MATCSTMERRMPMIFTSATNSGNVLIVWSVTFCIVFGYDDGFKVNVTLNVSYNNIKFYYNLKYHYNQLVDIYRGL